MAKPSPVSPLAPKSYPDLPIIEGVRFATAEAGIRYKGRTDVMLALMDKASYGAARAHNRHMADFCSVDDRLMGVAVVPLDDPALAMAELDNALRLGLQAVWVPHRPCGDRSPGHVDLDPFWARLAESGTPFVLHVGGAPLQAAKAWMNNGRPPTKDWLGGGENLRTKDIALAHAAPEAFVSMLVLDGVFERHPALRGAAVELGAAEHQYSLARIGPAVIEATAARI